MQVLEANNVKIYNLSSGKSLPEWLSDRKRRKLQQQDVDIRRRIELIQDFDMPGVSSCIRCSKDGQYIVATGIYKPRVRCYDVNNLSMKFERCLDSEVTCFEILSEDYSKMVFLQSDRFVEFHSQNGRYHTLRIPKFGRDMSYHTPSCDLYLVGASREVYRLNLERGQFLSPLVTDASTVNSCDVNPVHNLFVCGTEEGKIEAWDPRSHKRAGILDCVTSELTETLDNLDTFPSATKVKFRDGLILGVGMATGQTLLFDIRATAPLLIKDHMYGLPIKSIAFHPSQNLVLSMDSRVLKMWDQNSGKPLTSIESQTDLNDLCQVPNSGLLFMANEDKKILTYYIPTLGPAPKWCSFLDNLTEELEESRVDTVYDDYKFVTSQELDELGLNHLIGTELLRAYMHGFFLDMRLYRKAKAVAEPFNFEAYKQKKIKEKIDSERKGRVRKVEVQLPKVNREVARQLMEQEQEGISKKQKSASKLLRDERFKAMFENPEFEVDMTAPEYKLLSAVKGKVVGKNKKRVEIVDKPVQNKEPEEEEEEVEGKPSSEEDEEDSSSSDDDREAAAEIKKQHRLIRQEERLKMRQPKLYELHDSKTLGPKKKNLSKLSLGERLQTEAQEDDHTVTTSSGNQEMTFSLQRKKRGQETEEASRQHRQERKKLRRSAGALMSRPKPFKPWRR